MHFGQAIRTRCQDGPIGLPCMVHKLISSRMRWKILKYELLTQEMFAKQSYEEPGTHKKCSQNHVPQGLPT
jgi:hypothetical protein